MTSEAGLNSQANNRLQQTVDLYSKIQNLSDVSGVQTIVVADGGYITATATAATTWTLDFSGLTSGYVVACTLKLTNGGVDVQTFTDVKWSSATQPELTAVGVDRIVFTYDGVDIIGSLVNTAVA